MSNQSDIKGKGILVMPRTEAMFYGPGSAGQLPDAIAMTGMQRPFLLATPSLVKNGQVEALEKIIGAPLCGTYAGSTAHNQMPSVLAAVDAARASNADGLIAFGGSSVVDMSKSVAMILAEGNDLEALRIRYSPEDGVHIPALNHPKLPQIVVPTTLSGSEYTFAMAITDPDKREKLMFADSKLIPKIIFHDSEICQSTPDRLWAGTGMKIFADCLEMIMSLKAMPMGNLYAYEGLKVLFENLPKSIGTNTSTQAMQNLHYAAYLAMSMAFNVSLGLVAGVRHQLGGGKNVPHGEASTIMLPHVLRWNRETASAETALAAAARHLDLTANSDAALVDKLIEEIEAMVSGLGLPTTLSQVGVSSHDLPLIAEHVCGDSSVAFNPRRINTPDDVMQVLTQAI